MQYESPAANCSTPQDRRRWMLEYLLCWNLNEPGKH